MHEFGDYARFRATLGWWMAGILLVLSLSIATLAPQKAEAYGGWYSGQASWYALHGNYTYYGDLLTWEDWTVASPYLDPGTKLKICYEVCARGVVVTDLGPAEWTGRVLDMNQIVADKIGLTYAGEGTVDYKITGYDPNYANK